MNRSKALKVLNTKLYQLKREEEQKQLNALRTKTIGSGDRSERIRTYNFAQSRVTDHRIQFTVSGQLEDMVQKGDLFELVGELRRRDDIEKVEAYFASALHAASDEKQ